MKRSSTPINLSNMFLISIVFVSSNLMADTTRLLVLVGNFFFTGSDF